VIVKRLAPGNCFLMRCIRCGREYSFNIDLEIMLSYRDVKEWHERIEKDVARAAYLRAKHKAFAKAHGR
jgi:hypothetical protein